MPSIQLEDGCIYIDGLRREVWIAGPTADNPAWAYSVQGNWYERATGRFVATWKSGQQKVLDEGNFRNIVTSKATRWKDLA